MLKLVFFAILIFGLVGCFLWAGLMGHLSKPFGQSFSAIAFFNTLIPHDDKGGKAIAQNMSYGDHKRHKLDIYGPRGDWNERSLNDLPVLFFVYGGSWDTGRKKDYAFVGKAFGDLGYITVIADYRLVPEVVFPQFIDDGALALKWVVEHISEYGGDAEKIVLAGHSAGSYNAIMLALRHEDYLAPLGLPADTIKAMAALSGPFDFYPYDVEATINAFKGTDIPEVTQPYLNLSPDTPPILFAHGTKDSVVKLGNGDAAKSEVQQRDQSAEFEFGPWDHAGPLIMLAPIMRRRFDMRKRMDSFFKQYLLVE